MQFTGAEGEARCLGPPEHDTHARVRSVGPWEFRGPFDAQHNSLGRLAESSGPVTDSGRLAQCVWGWGTGTVLVGNRRCAEAH